MSDHQTAEGSAGAVASELDLTLDQRSALRDALDAIPELDEPDRWRKVLTQLRGTHAALDPQNFAPDYHTFDILDVAIGSKKALVDLATAIRLVLRRSAHNMAFTDLVNTLTSEGVPASQLDGLRALLVMVPPAIHTEALRHPEIAALTDTLAGTETAVQAFDRLGADGTWTSTGIRYLELVGHRLAKEQADLIHEALGAVLPHDARVRAETEKFCAALTAAAGVNAGQTEAPEEGGEPRRRSADGDKQMITLTLQETASIPAPPNLRSTVWGGVPPRNRNFAGRDNTLDIIRHTFQADTSAALVPKALHGFGGVGKTQIAIEYAYRFQDDYDLVWWVPADESRSIRRSLVSLARRLGLQESVDAEDTIGTVLDELRQSTRFERWLLIFDNADAPDSIQEYRPRAGNGHILVTSRSNRWLGNDATVSVDVFTEDESIAMLRNRWSGLSEDSARTLATRLGNLPLALEQAAAVHNESGMTLKEYLKALDETPTDVLAEGIPEGYSSSVAQTFQIAYRELSAKSPAAGQLFAICSMISSQPISVAMLIRGRGADLPSPLSQALRTEMTRRTAIRDMGGHALALLDSGRNLIRIHHLVRDLLREELSDDERATYTRAAHGILALANPGEPDRPENWRSLREISPHVVPSGILESPDPEARTVFLDQIRYLYAIGDYQTSRMLGEMAVSTWTDMLGPDDVMTMVANRHLANSLREQGDFPRVARINRETLDRMTRVLGPTDEHTLATANSVGADLRIAGEFEKARELDEKNLEAYRARLTDNDPATQRSANNLAVDLRLLGEFKKARELDDSIIRTLADMFGEDDVRTLRVYTGLARDLYGLGRYAKALSLQLEKLSIHEKLVDAGHTELLRGRRNEAILLRKNGHYGPALEKARAALQAYSSTFGETHDQTFAARLTLANTLRVVGELDEAEEAGRSALDAYKINLSPGHPITLAAMVDVAIILRLRDRLDEASEMNRTALDGLTATLGLDHQWRLCALANQAGLEAARDLPEEALKLSREAYSRSERVRGEEHPYSLACAANLSLDLEATGEHIESSAQRRSAISSLRKVLGSQHPEVINVGLFVRTDADIEPPPV